MVKIDTPTARKKLKTRREPHWHKLITGGYVGFRRTQNNGSWIARYRMTNEEGKAAQQYESLGSLNEFSPDEQFDEASKKAQDWFKTLGQGHKSGYTVEDAITDYAKHLKISNSAKTSKDTKARLLKHVPLSIQKKRLSKLTLSDMTSWRDSLVRVTGDDEDKRKSMDSANRVLSMLKAAFNLAYKRDIIGNDKAWRRIQAFKKVGSSRKIIFTDDQTKKLLSSAKGGLLAYLKSMLHTGMRPGTEPEHLLVEQFDPQNGTLEILESKTGTRVVFLSCEAVKHFKSIAKGKTPKAHLITKDDGTPWTKTQQYRAIKDLIKVAKLPSGTVPYTLRHTYISKAIRKGVPLQILAENCGTSIRMIETNYAKFLSEYRREMFDRVNLA